jgi:hypothetical protein
MYKTPCITTSTSHNTSLTIATYNFRTVLRVLTWSINNQTSPVRFVKHVPEVGMSLLSDVLPESWNHVPQSAPLHMITTGSE